MSLSDIRTGCLQQRDGPECYGQLSSTHQLHALLYAERSWRLLLRRGNPQQQQTEHLVLLPGLRRRSPAYLRVLRPRLSPNKLSRARKSLSRCDYSEFSSGHTPSTQEILSRDNFRETYCLLRSMKAAAMFRETRQQLQRALLIRRPETRDR